MNSKVFNCLKTLCIILLLDLPYLFPQDNEDIVRVAPGPEYEAGWLHNFFFGAHWRDLWITPIEIEILDLNTFDGGLIPLKKGGGYQTKSLQFKSKNGNTWKFRSVNKDPRKVLPQELQETIVGDILKDQISSSNPAAPLMVVPVLEAAGILQARPVLALLPDDEKLGEFREGFGGLVGMIEIHPDEPEEEDEKGFANSEKVSGTLKLFETLQEKKSNKIDDKAFLKARLADIFLGDWDRHVDQWRWARFDKGKKKIWIPIPRDRDQAFSKYDGLFPFVVEYLVPQLNHFGYDYTQAEDITWNGRFVDRRFLTELTKSEWDSITYFVQSGITDEVIENSLKRLPPEYYRICADELRSKMKSRRDKLRIISEEYYNLVNEVVDIYATLKDDYVKITRINDLETEVAVIDIDDQNRLTDTLYLKVFDNDITKEIRLYLLDGDDQVFVKGNTGESPLVRIIGGDGKDKITDSSEVQGCFLYVTPVPDAENKTRIYDSGDKTEIIYGKGTVWDKQEVPEPVTISERYEPQQRDRGHDWIIYPVLNFNSDDGLVIGGGPLLYSYNFRAVPYEYKMLLTASYAFKPSSYIISYEGDFKSLIKKTNLNLKLFKSELSLIKYYGFGNETVFSSRLEGSDYYRLSQELFSVQPTLQFFTGKYTSLGAGLSYNFSKTSLDNDTLLSSFGSRYGLGSFKLAGLHSFFEIDSREIENNPSSGIYFKLSGSFYPELFDNEKNFFSGAFDLRSYYTADILTETTFALRAGGEKIWGNFPFFKAVFLGGSDDLRGYSRERFSGEASLFGQAELRLFLSKFNLILLGKSGIHLFTEIGRVFTGNSNSEKWHPSYGCGFWISYLQKKLTFSFTAAASPEKTAFYIQTGFMF